MILERTVGFKDIKTLGRKGRNEGMKELKKLVRCSIKI
jgi:hypothetical protein